MQFIFFDLYIFKLTNHYRPKLHFGHIANSIQLVPVRVRPWAPGRFYACFAVFEIEKREFFRFTHFNFWRNDMTQWLRSIVIVIASLMVLSLPAGALAAPAPPGLIPSLSGVIHACYETHSNAKETKGVLRVVSNPTLCKSNETALVWSVQGIQGETGATGGDG